MSDTHAPPMRLCLICHASWIHTRHWAGYFRDRGHAVRMISLTPGAPVEGVPLTVVGHRAPTRYERTNWHYLLTLPRLRAALRDAQADIVNAHFVSSNGFLAALARPAGCRLVLSAHGSDMLVFPRKSPVHRWGTRFALHRADLITSAAPNLTEVMRSLGIPSERVLTQQYGVRTDVFHPPASDEARAPRVVSARALVPPSHVSSIIGAAVALTTSGTPLEFLIAGEGPERERLEAQARPLTATGTIAFRGQIAQTALADALRTAAIYCAMTESDSASLALQEAMACGAFPVVSDTRANRDWITDGNNGFLVPLDAPDVLAEKLDAAWRDAELRRAAAERNWRIVRTRSDFATNMGIIEQAFQRLRAAPISRGPVAKM